MVDHLEAKRRKGKESPQYVASILHKLFTHYKINSVYKRVEIFIEYLFCNFHKTDYMIGNMITMMDLKIINGRNLEWTLTAY